MMHYKPVFMEIGLAVKSLAGVWLFTLSGNNLMSGIGSLAVTLYFTGMIRINIVEKHYGGSWRAYIRSWLLWKPIIKIYNRFKKRLKSSASDELT